MFFKWILWIVTAWAPMNPDQPPWMWSYSLSRTTPRATASWSAGQPPCWGCVSVWSTSTRTSLPPSSGSFSRTLNRLEMQFAEVLSCSVLSRRRVWAKKKGLRIKNLNLDILNSFVSEKGDDLEGGIYCNCPENCNDVVYSQEIIASSYWAVLAQANCFQEVTSAPFRDINNYFLQNAVTGQCNAGACPISNKLVNKEYLEIAGKWGRYSSCVQR